MPDVEGASTGAIGLHPYADRSEHTGPPEIITIPDRYREFLATDARSVLITLFPNHFNYIPNPAFRVDATGWEIDAKPAPDAYSWTFVSGTSTENAGYLNAIIGGTTATVEPDPSTADPYVNGQLVWISDLDVWLIIDDALTLTVAQAAAAGLGLSADVSGYRVWDPVTDALVPDDSWVGQSVRCYGAGSMRYREAANQFVYVGPKVSVIDATSSVLGYSEYGSAEWTFSIYARGSGRVRLKMDAYFPSDLTVANSDPEYQNLNSTADPFTEPAGDAALLGPDGNVWLLIDPLPSAAPFYESLDRPPAFASIESEWEDIEDNGRWQRVVLPTTARLDESLGSVEFAGAWWIDAQVEFDGAEDLLLSAAMLDPTEYPECAYFDGSMTEDPTLDDFIWEGTENDSVSQYYFDRQLRTRWLWERLKSVVPAGRPYQIFFGAYDRPFVPPDSEATGV